MAGKRDVAAALGFWCIGCVASGGILGDSMVLSRPAVVGGTRIVFGVDAFIELRPSGDPLAVAEIVFRNRIVNGPQDNGTYHLVLGEVEVDVTFTWDPGGRDDDRIEVLTGPAFWVHEPSLDVREGSDAVMPIYPALS